MKALRSAIRSPFWGEQLLALRTWGTATVLCTIAAVHAWRVHRDHLTQWKGAGFGMFSTIDSGGNRELVLRIRSEGLEYVGRFPGGAGWADTLLLVRYLPSQDNLRGTLSRLAREMWMPTRPSRTPAPYAASSDADWLRSRSLGIWPSLTRVRRAVLEPAGHSPDPSMDLVLPESLTLEVQRTDFDLRTGRTTRSLLTSATIPGLSIETLAEEWGCTLEYLQGLRSI